MKEKNIVEKLKNLQKIDSRTRVFLGKQYEKLLTYYIMPLNIGFVKSNISATNLVDLQTQISSERESFNRMFVEYSQVLEGLITTSCDDGDGFLDKITKVREKRQKLNGKVKEMSLMFENYATGVKEIKTVQEKERAKDE